MEADEFKWTREFECEGEGKSEVVQHADLCASVLNKTAA